jgi:carotenoid cleavage dioxygenase-like enzyme
MSDVIASADMIEGASIGPPALADVLLPPGREVEDCSLEVRGRFPEWLCGSLLTTRSGLYEVGGRPLRHWFDGLALLTRLSFAGGSARYCARYLRSEAGKAAMRGALRYREFSVDPIYATWARLRAMVSTREMVTDNGSVNVARIGEHFSAETESAASVRFDPVTLRTLGPVAHGDRLRGHLATAHPHYLPSGATLNVLTRYGALRSWYQLYTVEPSSSSVRRLVARMPVTEPAYMHGFTITDRFAILTECPLVVTPWRLLTAATPWIDCYRWRPERGVRFLVFDRWTGELRAVCRAEAFFTFHHVNAFELDERRLVVDLSAYRGTELIETLYLDHLRSAGASVAQAELRRYTLDLDQGTASHVPLIPDAFELSSIHYERFNGRPYRFAYGPSFRRDRAPRFANRQLKVDTESGRTWSWYEEDSFTSEPLFVARPGGREEDDGLLLCFVNHSRRDATSLIALDAQTMSEVARASLPHRVPLAFHSLYAADIRMRT